MNKKVISDILQKAKDLCFIVWGDVMLDIYQRCYPAENRESTSPTLKFKERACAAGGAAHTALALRAFGPQVIIVGTAAYDEAGQELLRLLYQARVDVRFMSWRNAIANTISKTRYISNDRYILRFDQDAFYFPTVKEMLLATKAYPKAHVVVSSYGYGTVDLTQYVANSGQTIRDWIISPKTAIEASSCRGCHVVCNHHECKQFCLPSKRSDVDKDNVNVLFDSLSLRELVVTCSAAPVIARDKNSLYEITPQEIKNPNPIGAGDCFLAAYSVARCTGYPIVDAIEFACLYAGLSVKSHYPATPVPDPAKLL